MDAFVLSFSFDLYAVEIVSINIAFLLWTFIGLSRLVTVYKFKNIWDGIWENKLGFLCKMRNIGLVDEKKISSVNKEKKNVKQIEPSKY